MPAFWPMLQRLCRCQPLAMPRPAGSGAAIAAIRRNAAMPTAIAPTTEKAICQVSDGMACFTMPWVA